MPKFNIAVSHVEMVVFEIEAETWSEAVEKASEKSDEAGLETVGAFKVFDEDFYPVDTRGK